MKQPKFTYSDVKYSTSKSIFERALKLFESGHVGPITSDYRDYLSTVQGTKAYEVSVSMNRSDELKEGDLEHVVHSRKRI